MSHKICPRCKLNKPLTDYHRSCRTKNGHSATCKECSKLWHHNYYLLNKERVFANARRWKDRHPERYAYLTRRARKKPHRVEQRKAYRKLPQVKIRCNLRYKLRTFCRGIKKSSMEKIVGCSFLSLKSHLEKLWQPGMSWKNYGQWKLGEPMTWHIDHIKPCAMFDLSDPEQQRICFHYTNLQPLWALDNIRKGMKC